MGEGMVVKPFSDVSFCNHPPLHPGKFGEGNFSFKKTPLQQKTTPWGPKSLASLAALSSNKPLEQKKTPNDRENGGKSPFKMVAVKNQSHENTP